MATDSAFCILTGSWHAEFAETDMHEGMVVFFSAPPRLRVSHILHQAFSELLCQ